MTEIQVPIKVYELARELGMDSISLLDTFKKMDIEVKSHMSSLQAEQALAVKDFLKQQSRAKKTKSKKKKTVQKKKIEKKPATAVLPKKAKKKTLIKRRAGTKAVETEEALASKKETKSSVAKVDAKEEKKLKKSSSPSSSTQKKATTFQEDDSTFSSPRGLKIIKDIPEKKPDEGKGADHRSAPFYRQGKEKGDGSKDMFKPMTSVLRRDDFSKKKSTGLSSSRTKEDVKVGDFRKREIIFQPKRKKFSPGKTIKKTQITTPSAHKRKIKIENTVSVSELAQRMKEKPKNVLKRLTALGVEANVDNVLDVDTATLLANEFNYEIENATFDESKFFGKNSDKVFARHPVVTVMGHVDHGKTTLLDALRDSSVVSGEAGGITQHIGAYSVDIKGHTITFLDTPGHEAFKVMRQRGANVTDIVVLVVAADDGIMPQTVEAIKHAQNASVPIIVAANKIDKPEANIEKLKQSLSENNLLIEEWGGEVPMLPISAMKKKGLKELLEAINLQAEVLELKADPHRLAQGIVLESKVVKGRGTVVDLLVQQGTLRSGDYVVVGTSFGRIRSMMDDKGKSIREVGPAYPVEVTGLDSVPEAGEILNALKSEGDAKKVIAHRKEEVRKKKEQSAVKKPLNLDQLFAQKQESDNKKHFNLMLKADVNGSLEAIESAILGLPSEKVQIKIIATGVGDITENDVMLAQSSQAHIFSFGIKVSNKAKAAAKQESVPIKSFNIIYELLDNVKESMEDLLAPIRTERLIGKAMVKKAFTVSKIGTIAGCIVMDGKIERNVFARIYRGKEVIHEGNLFSVKRFKDDVKEVTKGQECGIGVEKYTDIGESDQIEAFHIEYKKARL